MWAKKGQQPLIKTPGGRKGINIIGVVDPATGRVFAEFVDSLKTDEFQRFLQQVLAEFGGLHKIWIILDNARVHHAKALQLFLQEVQGALELIYLPSYSPDLNVIERLWRLLRKEVTHNMYFPTFEEFSGSVQHFFEKHKCPSEEISSLCAIN